MIVYFDMDGVLCDFAGQILKLYGKPYHQDMWKDIVVRHPRLYSLLQPFADMVELCNNTPNAKILTAKPSLIHMEFCGQDKRVWCNTHLKPSTEVYVVPTAYDKQMYATANSILIDDSEINIHQWLMRGGVGILHTNFDETNKTLARYLTGKV